MRESLEKDWLINISLRYLPGILNHRKPLVFISKGFWNHKQNIYVFLCKAFCYSIACSTQSSCDPGIP